MLPYYLVNPAIKISLLCALLNCPLWYTNREKRTLSGKDNKLTTTPSLPNYPLSETLSYNFLEKRTPSVGDTSNQRAIVVSTQRLSHTKLSEKRKPSKKENIFWRWHLQSTRNCCVHSQIILSPKLTHTKMSEKRTPSDGGTSNYCVHSQIVPSLIHK